MVIGMKREYVLDGFVFDNEKEYKEALKEHNNIKYIREKLNMEDIKVAKKAYERLIASDNVNTVVGLAYLSGLRNRLKKEKSIKSDELINIPVKVNKNVENESIKEIKRKYSTQKNNNKLLVKQLEKAKSTKLSFIIVSGCLFIVIIAMFIITLTSDTSTYSNAKESVLDEYASWQEQLDERERKLDEKENEINNIQNNLKAKPKKSK